jgi:hypothetical protein
MNRPIESDYTSLTAYTRSLEEYCDGLVQPAPVQEPVAWSSYEYDGIHHKPVAWMDRDGNFSDNNDHRCFPIPLYTITHPPAAQRTWVGLTDDEIDYIMAFVNPHCNEIDFARAIEAKLRSKNG